MSSPPPTLVMMGMSPNCSVLNLKSRQVPVGVIQDDEFDAVTFAVNNNNATVEMLIGSNFKRWKQDIEFALGIVDMDLALREDEPARPNDQSTADQKAHYARWEKSNRLSLIAMKRSIAEHLWEKDIVSDKAEAGNLLSELTNIRYDAAMGVREFILKMVHIQSKLKAHEIVLSENYIVHQALNVLPDEFSLIKIAYNARE
ncbi:uncharacterized protein LOC120291600 [Eucalyptus grandis]|uniref:uncharacterized protein LOC120291600 n=1 Tax=Eucalyptus grandis TaxID=71139 RepID=UPI00192EE679|nr:uncharacterized protein LOC120291600 [Eucalyptus grandis]